MIIVFIKWISRLLGRKEKPKVNNVVKLPRIMTLQDVLTEVLNAKIMGGAEERYYRELLKRVIDSPTGTIKVKVE